MARMLGRPRIQAGGRHRIDETLLMALEAFTGLTTVVGGVALMARPDGSLMQMAPSALAALAQHSPFPDFFIPGLALAVIVGGGMLGAAALLWRRRPYALELAVASGAALVIFELVELIAIGFMPLQAFEAMVGLLVVSLAGREWVGASHTMRHAVG